MIIMRGIAVHAGVCYAYESACSDWLRAKIYKLSFFFFSTSGLNAGTV